MISIDLRKIKFETVSLTITARIEKNKNCDSAIVRFDSAWTNFSIMKSINEEWDAVVMGTGMKECLLSGLLSVAGKKVLHVDRNNYYGGASASLDIQQLFSKFAGSAEPSAL